MATIGTRQASNFVRALSKAVQALEAWTASRNQLRLLYESSLSGLLRRLVLVLYIPNEKSYSANTTAGKIKLHSEVGSLSSFGSVRSRLIERLVDEINLVLAHSQERL